MIKNDWPTTVDGDDAADDAGCVEGGCNHVHLPYDYFVYSQNLNIKYQT